MATKRTWIVDEALDEDGVGLGHYDRDEALACMEEIEHLLFMVGGMVAFAAERVQVAEHGGEPLGVSRRLIVTWSSFAPMRREEPAAPPEPAEPELEAAADELASQLMGGFDEAAAEDEEVDRSLTTTGAPRADASL